MQTIEFGPAHLHRDIVGTDGWIRDEIQLNQIAFQNRRAAYRSIDYSFSHDESAARRSNAMQARRRMDWKVRFTNHANTKHERRDALSSDGLNYVYTCCAHRHRRNKWMQLRGAINFSIGAKNVRWRRALMKPDRACARPDRPTRRNHGNILKQKSARQRCIRNAAVRLIQALQTHGTHADFPPHRYSRGSDNGCYSIASRMRSLGGIDCQLCCDFVES